MNARGLRRMQGLTLVELMVALVLGLLVIGGTINLFVATKRTYTTEEALSQLQENGRFAFSFLRYDLQMAGFQLPGGNGCLSDSSQVENVLNDTTDYAWDTGSTLSVHDAGSGSWTSALPTTLSGSVTSGTDALSARFLSADTIPLTSPYSDSAQLFVTTAGEALSQGDIAIVTDCSNATIFQITNLQTAGGKVDVVHSASNAFTPGDSTAQFGNSYGEGSFIARLVTHAYYVGTTTSGRPALFRASLGGDGSSESLSKQELVENVEDMQLLYGVDIDGDGEIERYVSGANVTDTSQILAVRIALLIRSTNEVRSSADTTTTYQLLDKTDGPFNDRYLRQVFTTTVTLRNRML